MKPRPTHRLLAPCRAVVLGLRLAIAPLCAWGVAGCSTPSVPLPPPAVDTSALTFSAGAAQGTIVLTGVPRFQHQAVRFYLVNRTTGDGVITATAADGSFTTEPLAATVGDVAELYFEQADGDRSETVCLTVLLEQTLFGTGCP